MWQVHSGTWHDGNSAHVLVAIGGVTTQAETDDASTVEEAMNCILITPIIHKTLKVEFDSGSMMGQSGVPES